MLEPDQTYTVAELIAIFEQQLQKEPVEDLPTVSLLADSLVFLRLVAKWNGVSTYRGASRKRIRRKPLKGIGRANQA